MSRIMFPFSPRELAAPESEDYKPKKEWRRQGFFKERNPQRYAQEWRAVKAFDARHWLEAALMGGPLPAVTVLNLARDEGINEWSLRRAKKHHGIRSVRVGGKHRGWGAVWMWQFPAKS
jgi:hypothetical protein